MGEIFFQHPGFLKAVARKVGLATAPALALALGIGVNGAIFGLEGLNHSPQAYPNPLGVLLQSNYQAPRESDELPAGGDDLSLNAFMKARRSAPIFSPGGEAFLVGSHHFTLAIPAESAGVIHSIGRACQ